MNTNRRAFLKTRVLGGAAALLGLGELARQVLPGRDIVLPFLEGPRRIRLLAPGPGLWAPAHAQNFRYYAGGSYGAMAPYDEWLAHAQARQRWEAQMAAWRAMQQYQWMQAAHQARMRMILAQYQNYAWVGKPDVWDSVQSVYGFAKDNAGTPVLFGMGADRSQVQVKASLKGASSVWSKLGEHYARDEQERAVGPQSAEVPVKIMLPDGSALAGNGYKTAHGALGVSRQTVQTADGQVGNLAKFTTGPDGNQYLVI